MSEIEKSFILLDFFSKTCSSCQTMEVVLRNIKLKWHSEVAIVSIDVEQNATLVDLYKISTVPTFILMKENEIIWKKSGLISTNDFHEKLVQLTENNNV